MDYYLLADLAVKIGHKLAVSGAETFRVEETMRRIIASYGIDGEAFAIPGAVAVSFEAANSKPLTIMKRVGFHGNDLEAVEKINALSRRICTEVPEPREAERWFSDTLTGMRSYSVPIYYFGSFIAAAGFCCVFGGSPRDWLWAGLCGLVIGLVTRIMDKFEVNPFFSTIAASFLMAIPAYIAAGLGLAYCAPATIIGALMLLVPGLLITNSMRDIIYGDTNSGITRIVQVLLSAFAIAMGTAAALSITQPVFGHALSAPAMSWPVWLQCAATFIACSGFFIVFNVHDWGSILCALGSALTWFAYLMFQRLGFGVFMANFCAEVIAAVYAESMARMRKYPATSYLVISSIPLLPGAGIYYTMSYGLSGEGQLALSKGLETAGIAGSLAVGILLVSTIFRMAGSHKSIILKSYQKPEKTVKK